MILFPQDRLLRPGLLSVILLAAATTAAQDSFTPVMPRRPKADEIPLTRPGSYAREGGTYILTRDVSSPMTPIFLGRNVTLDLNGHRVTFADGGYESIPNGGFEEGLKGWDRSRAPGARILPKEIRPMVGDRILSLAAGDEILSPYITLPVAQRTYYAMCAVAAKEMRITINVDDARGRPVTCTFRGRREPVSQPPLSDRGPPLGGGVLFAHLHHLPAGRYRLRIKAETDCLIDECDIRPGLDAGVAVVGAVKPYATYDDALKWHPCAFFDYNREDSRGVPVKGIPVVKGEGRVTIRNGTIAAGAPGLRTLGVHCNAPGVTVVLENVRIINSGINANALRLRRGRLERCRFEVDTPFIIDRHNTTEAGVRITRAEEIARCEFIGGQGCFSGTCPEVHHNLFVNRQTASNHYAVHPGSGSRIYHNRFLPEIGSGVFIGRVRDVRLHENTFRVCSSPPNCEYRHGCYSTVAVRLSDYNEKAGAPLARRCTDNSVYGNTIHVESRSHPSYKDYTPRAFAFFISVGGGVNRIHHNRITVKKTDRGNCRALAFFVGGSRQGGLIHHNRVASNCPAAWIGTDYGSAGEVTFHDNTFERLPGTPSGTRPFILGNGGNTVGGAGFYSNEYDGWRDLFAIHSHAVAYSLGWTLRMRILDRRGKPAVGLPLVLSGGAGPDRTVTTDGQGRVEARLAVTRRGRKGMVEGDVWQVAAGGLRRRVEMKGDREMTLRLR